MFGFIDTLFTDLHPIVVHFPIAFFTLSFLLVLVGRVWPQRTRPNGCCLSSAP